MMTRRQAIKALMGAVAAAVVPIPEIAQPVEPCWGMLGTYRLTCYAEDGAVMWVRDGVKLENDRAAVCPPAWLSVEPSGPETV